MISAAQELRGAADTFLDLDLLVNRAIGWIGWKYKAGWVEWEFDWNAFAAWYEPKPKEPRRIYNGSGGFGPRRGDGLPAASLPVFA